MGLFSETPENSSGTFLHQCPTIAHQATYFATGALAGVCATPFEVLHNHFFPSDSRLPRFRNLASSSIYRAGVRFWIFDITKSQLAPTQIPLSLCGALSGAAGGFAEVLGQSAAQRKLPNITTAGNQALRLFLCFGTFTYLSSMWYPERVPPSSSGDSGDMIRRGMHCWTLGAVAGGLGNTAMAVLQGARGKMLLGQTLKGVGFIGTVIGVQVTSCAEVLRMIE